MPIYQPSQYQVNNMEQGDIIYIKKRKPLYKLYRKLFLNKPKIKVKKFWNSTEYDIVYQEDCTLLYYYEVVCIQEFSNIPVIIGKEEGSKSICKANLKKLQVGLYNIMLVFSNGLTLSLPTDYISRGIKQNQNKLKIIDNSRVVSELLKFQRHKGDYFKRYAEEHSIDKWESAYCSVCGKPVIFNFKCDNIIVDNQCNCGELKLDKKEFTYDEFSVWYYCQTSKIVRKRYDEFWFGKE